MSDDERLKSVNDLNTGAVVTNLTAVACSIHKLGDQGELSLQKKYEELVNNCLYYILS